jgi:hypothetical protein
MEENTGIKIIDRRRFDSSGSEREDNKTEQAPEMSKAQSPKEEPVQNKREKPEDGISFSSLVMSLATQCLMQLGEMDSQGGLAVPVDLDGAKQTIEILGMLEKKTKGNLSKDEEQLLEEVLHNLRLSFVKVAQRRG